MGERRGTDGRGIMRTVMRLRIAQWKSTGGRRGIVRTVGRRGQWWTLMIHRAVSRRMPTQLVVSLSPLSLFVCGDDKHLLQLCWRLLTLAILTTTYSAASMQNILQYTVRLPLASPIQDNVEFHNWVIESSMISENTDRPLGLYWCWS